MSKFHNVLFPPDVSWGSSGGPIFNTGIFEAFKGKEKRNINWAQPMMKFNVAYGIRTDLQMDKIVQFFNARRGRANGFRYKNWADYTVVNGPVAVGDGKSNRLPLWKYYGTPPRGFYKRLSHIVLGSVNSVTHSGSAFVEGSDFYIDYDLGEIVTTAILALGQTIEATLEFDEPVNFETDSIKKVIDAYNSNSLTSLSLMSYRNSTVIPAAFSTEDKNITTDSFLKHVACLVKFSSTTSDVSPNNSLVTFIGGSGVDTTKKLSTDASFTTNGLGSAVVGTTKMVAGTPFTIEAFLTNGGGNFPQHIISSWDVTGADRSWSIRYDPTISQLQFVISPDGSAEIILLRALWVQKADKPFEFVSVDAAGNGLYVMRINGEPVSSVAYNSSLHIPATGAITVGDSTTLDGGHIPFTGNIDSLRITSGKNRYNKKDTITVPYFFNINY